MQQEQLTRLQRFKTFMCSPTADAELRVACLCLQLTKHAINMVSKRADEQVVLTQLANGNLLDVLGRQAGTLLASMHMDERLPFAQALTRLLVTLSHLIVRFQMFESYPALLYSLTSQHNAHGYLGCVMSFVDMRDASLKLDAGCSKHYWDEAWAGQSEQAAVQYLTSKPVQQELSLLIQLAQATSLDVERKHAVDKKSERSKVR
eukprot:3966275-Amphidinium_carterae.1